MTAIYTDPNTGKKYDRQLQGVYADSKEGFGCTGCAFSTNVNCPAEYCMYPHPSDMPPDTGKRVYFVFKERQA